MKQTHIVKPVPVTALQFVNMDSFTRIHELFPQARAPKAGLILIETPGASIHLSYGEWLILDAEGTPFHMPDDRFRALYEPLKKEPVPKKEPEPIKGKKTK